MKRTNKSGIVLIYNCSGPKFTKLGHIFAMLGLVSGVHARPKPQSHELYIRYDYEKMDRRAEREARRKARRAKRNDP